jgi:hypothetical protein
VQETWLSRIDFDFAAEAGDLDVDGAFAGFVHFEGGGEVFAGEDFVGAGGQGGEEGGFTAG